MEDGTYLVVNAKSGLALDVAGASDSSGTNVQQWTVNHTDAQIWALTTDDVGKTALRCSLTGKTLDVAGGTMADGQNVRQWDDNSTAAQRWVIAEDGKTATVAGKSRATYTVKSAKNASFALDVSAGGTTAGTNVQIYTANGTDAQRWAFVPVPAMTEGGTYEIVSALDDGLCLDVSGGSTANGARLQIYTRNGTDAQVFAAHVDDDTMLAELVCVKSGKALDSAFADRDGTPIHQWQRLGIDNQRWLAVQAGTMEVNGRKVPTYELRAKSSTGRCMDVAGGKSSAQTTVQCWTQNGTLAQRFAFVKTEAEMAGLASPNPLGLSAVGGRFSTASSVRANGRATVWPCWRGSAGKYDARYQVISHRPGKADSTTAWRALSDGSESNDGWGDAWSPMVVDSLRDVVSSYGIAVETSATVDCVELRVQARSYSPDYNGFRAHSAATDRKLRVCYAPSVECIGVTFVPDRGAVVSLRSDSAREGCTATVRLLDAGGKAVSGKARATGLGQTADVAIPIESLMAIPRDGDALVVDLTWQTPYVTVTDRLDAEMSYGSGHGGLSLSPEVSDDPATRCKLVSMPTAATMGCWVLVERGHGRSFEPCASFVDGGSTVFRVPPMLNRPTPVFLVARKSESQWSTWGATFEMESGEYLWNWGEAWDETAVVRLGINKPPSSERKYSADADVSATSGRDLPVAHGGSTVATKLDVSGALVPGHARENETDKRIDALAYALADGHCPVYRSPHGDWYRVAVTGAKVGLQGMDSMTVDVKQEAVSV